MNVSNFVQKLNKASFEKEAISVVLHSYISSFSSEEEQFEETCKQFIESIVDDSFSAFGSKLGTCRSLCQKEIDNIGDDPEEEYLKKLKSVADILAKLNSIFSEVAGEKYKRPDNVSATVAQHENSLKEIQGKIKSLNDDVSKANKLIDDKIFSLLINTVAILGIFVAIAFTGFGVMSIFSKLDIASASQSISAFIKNVFFILLIILGAYNLLLLLIYFIFKLSRPFPNNTGQVTDGELSTLGGLSFSRAINLTPFLIIDAILLVLALVAFIASVNVK